MNLTFPYGFLSNPQWLALSHHHRGTHYNMISIYLRKVGNIHCVCLKYFECDSNLQQK